MRTTLDLPTRLLREAQKSIRARTKTETIVRGLEALLRQKKLEEIVSLKGKLPLKISLTKSRERHSSK